MDLRDYQNRGIDDICSGFRSGNMRQCYTLPTGGGKSVMIAEMVRRAESVGYRALVLVHRTELIKQISRAQTVPHGIIKAGMDINHNLPVQVASVQTLARRQDRYPEFDFIIPDECHHVVAGQWVQIIAANPRARILGFTATPCRLDNRGLGGKEGFDNLLLGPSKLWLINNGYLVPSKVFYPRAIDLKGVKTERGDYATSQAMQVMDRPAIYGDVIKQWRKWANGKLTAAFCINVEHSKKTAAVFNDNGIPAAHLDGDTPADERAEILEKWARGEYLVVCNCNLFTEGFDLPAIECVVCLRPTKSLSLYLQMCGRANRTATGKQAAIILDHAGNIYRHDHPDIDRDWQLTTGRIHCKPPVLKTCYECYATFYPTTRCPVCDALVTVTKTTSRKKIKTLPDAELVLFNGEGWKANDLRTLPFKKAIQKAETVEDLKAIARARGYHPKWVERQIAMRPRFQGNTE